MSIWRANDSYGNEDSQDFDDPNSSCSSSCDSSCCEYQSDYFLPEWNDAILENGELFFIKCSPFINVTFTNEADLRSNASTKKRYKLSKFLKKHRFKKRNSINCMVQNNDENSDAPECGNASDYIDVDDHLASVLYVNLVGTEPNDLIPGDDIIYYFPQTADKNVIHSVRGALLTLYHLLPKLVAEDPESSTLLINEDKLHLMYIEDGRDLLIIASPENKCSLFELKQLSMCIVRYLQFRYKSLQGCFKNPLNYASLNQFFGNLFIKMFKSIADSSSHSMRDTDVPEIGNCVQFEDTFGFPSKLTVSHHLEMKIEEKLNELEANDFGDLSEDRNGCQRFYSILGTCIYYKGYLIVSHLCKEDQLDVHAFLRLNDLLDLTVTSNIESLIVWQEVFLSSCCYRVEGLRTFPPNRRWFLSIIGQGQGLLITLLESGGCSFRSDSVCKPDELYIDEFQETLNDVLHFGLSDIIEQSIKNNSKISTQHTISNQKSFENLSVSACNNANNLTKSTSTLSCESDTCFHHSSSTFDDGYSDSLSRTNSSIFNDDTAPVLGRRAQRMKQMSSSGNIYPLHCSLSDSDRSDFDTTGSSHSSSFLEEGKKPREGHLMRKIIHGSNEALFHFVNLHPNNGVLICSADTYDQKNATYNSIMNSFRSYAQKIHRILSQKKISNIGRYHRNCLPVKEYGTSFKYIESDEKKRSIIYWVVGRAFHKDNLGEVYVCYEDRMPQNLIEIAFRLAMST